MSDGISEVSEIVPGPIPNLVGFGRVELRCRDSRSRMPRRVGRGRQGDRGSTRASVPRTETRRGVRRSERAGVPAGGAGWIAQAYQRSKRVARTSRAIGMQTRQERPRSGLQPLGQDRPRPPGGGPNATFSGRNPVGRRGQHGRLLDGSASGRRPIPNGREELVASPLRFARGQTCPEFSGHLVEQSLKLGILADPERANPQPFGHLAASGVAG